MLVDFHVLKYNPQNSHLKCLIHIHSTLLNVSTEPIFQFIIEFTGFKFNFLFNLMFMHLVIEKFHGEFKVYWISGKLQNILESDVLSKGEKEAEKKRGKVKILFWMLKSYALQCI